MLTFDVLNRLPVRVLYINTTVTNRSSRLFRYMYKILKTGGSFTCL